MKYIRTKDGELHFNLGKTKNGIIIEYNYLGDGLDLAINYDAIEKQADTIEELCDCLVLWKAIRHSKAKRDIDEIAIKIKYKEAYYVAKMNEKGELELL